MKKTILFSALTTLFLSSCELPGHITCEIPTEPNYCEMQDSSEVFGTWRLIETKEPQHNTSATPHVTIEAKKLVINPNDSTITHISNGLASSYKESFNIDKRLSSITNEDEYFLDSYPMLDTNSNFVMCSLGTQRYYDIKCDTLFLYEELVHIVGGNTPYSTQTFIKE